LNQEIALCCAGHNLFFSWILKILHLCRKMKQQIGCYKSKILSSLLPTSLIALALSVLSTSGANIAYGGGEPQNNPSSRERQSHTAGWVGVTSYPVVPNSEANDLACYMQTAEGTTLDLRQLCPGKLTKQLLETGECVRCDLSGANLAGLDLSNVNLSDTNLSNADLSETNLSSANLDGADLSGADLSDANLRNTIMPDGKIHN
jgi:hypothetical protein